MRWVLRLRRAWVSWDYDYYDEQIGAVVKSVRWGVGPGLTLAIHYWPRRVWCLHLAPREPERCSWEGCGNRPLIGDTECDEHALPF